MVAAIPRSLTVEPDTFLVTGEAVLLAADVSAGLAICLHDDMRGLGGLLHLRYCATGGDRPLAPDDSRLGSIVLQIDRFCEAMQRAGSRAQWWRVRIVAHVAATPVGQPAASVLELVRDYFIDSPKPVARQELQHPRGVTVRLHAREGQLWTSGLVMQPPRPALSLAG